MNDHGRLDAIFAIAVGLLAVGLIVELIVWWIRHVCDWGC